MGRRKQSDKNKKSIVEKERAPAGDGDEDLVCVMDWSVKPIGSDGS